MNGNGQPERPTKLRAIGAGEGGEELALCDGTLSIEGEDGRVSQAAPLPRSGAMKLTYDEPLIETAKA